MSGETTPDPQPSAPEPTVGPEQPQPVPTPAATAPKQYPFRVMGVLGTALRVTKHNFVSFFLLALVVDVPVILLQLGGALEDVLLSMFVGFITGAFMQAVVVYGVVMELQGARPSTAACFRAGFSHVGRVVGVTLVSTLAICGAMLALVVPGIIVALMFYVVVPVTIVEGLGVGAAMKRSKELTHGRKGDIFLILFCALLVGLPIQLVTYELSREAAVVWQALSSALSSMFFAVVAGVTYIELRKLREGLHVPDMAAAFARFRKS